MRSSNRRGVLVLAIVAATFHQGCLGGGDSTSGGCDKQPFGETDFRSCPVPQAVGSHHETGRDGRVDVTAGEAWPDRAEELRLTPAELAEGCAASAVCQATSSDPTMIGIAFQSCLQGRTDFFSTEKEERAIPIELKNERLPFFLREAIAAKGDCTKVNAALTSAPSFLYCEEDGCIARQKHEVTCEGAVAVFDDGTRRDCSRAEAECSTASETGCTDRRFPPATREPRTAVTAT